MTYPPQPQTSQPKKRRKLWLIVLAVVVFLAIVGQCSSKGDDKRASTATTSSSSESASAAAISQARPAPTNAEVTQAFQAFVEERAKAGVMLAQSVIGVTAANGVVTVTIDAPPAVLSASPFSNLAELFGTPVAFNDDESVWLREAVRQVEVVDPNGADLGMMSAVELNKKGAG